MKKLAVIVLSIASLASAGVVRHEAKDFAHAVKHVAKGVKVVSVGVFKAVF